MWDEILSKSCFLPHNAKNGQQPKSPTALCFLFNFQPLSHAALPFTVSFLPIFCSSAVSISPASSPHSFPQSGFITTQFPDPAVVMVDNGKYLICTLYTVRGKNTIRMMPEKPPRNKKKPRWFLYLESVILLS